MAKIEFLETFFLKDNRRLARIKSGLLSAVLRANGLPALTREELLQKLERAEFHEVSEEIKKWKRDSTGSYQGPRC